METARSRPSRKPPSSLRAGAVVFHGGQLVAIERRWAGGEHYFLIPGGRVENGERPEETVVREFQEETGLTVQVGRLLATVQRGPQAQRYYLAEVVGGAFGPGDDQAVLLPLDALASLDLRPLPVRDLIVRAAAEGWPTETLAFEEAATV